jgi:Domain of unknown function (DUF6916)
MNERDESRGLTRGGLFKVGAVAALAVGAGGAGSTLAGAAGMGAAASGIRKSKDGPAYLSHAAYVPLVGTEFRLHPPGTRALPVRLIEARQTQSVGESFSLLFRTRVRGGIDGGIYRLEHPSLGGFELFVSPVSRGVRGQEIEAVINRIAT